MIAIVSSFSVSRAFFRGHSSRVITFSSSSPNWIFAMPISLSEVSVSPPRHRHRAAAHDALDLGEVGELLHEPVDLGPVAHDLERPVPLVVAEHVAAELVQQGRELLLGALRRPHLEEGELALDVVDPGHVGDAHHVDQLAELLGDLRDDVVGARGDQREA
jgi:hypothetical protein